MTKKIITIGNAIVDILCKTTDEFLKENNLIKNSMSLIDETMTKTFLELPLEKISSGGSASNSAAALSQLGNKVSFIGKVGNDEFGKKFISEISKAGVEFLSDKNHQKPTAKSFILVTPDASRTMSTFLGCASQISEKDINEATFKNASILYLEGYLWDAPATIAALKKAISYAKKYGTKIAFSLSDSFCVARHKKDFLELIQSDLDILFANEAEALELSTDFPKLAFDNKNLIAVVTKNYKGCEVFYDQKSFSMPAEKVENLVDTTGAGDIFAAGFLHGLVSNFDLEDSAKFGNKLASKIIQKFGARFEEEELNHVK